MKVVKSYVQLVLMDNDEIKKIIYFTPKDGELIQAAGQAVVKIATEKRRLEFKFDVFKDASSFLHRLFFSSSENTFTFQITENNSLKSQEFNV